MTINFYPPSYRAAASDLTIAVSPLGLVDHPVELPDDTRQEESRVQYQRPALCRVEHHASTMREPQAQPVPPLRRARHHGVRRLAGLRQIPFLGVEVGLPQGTPDRSRQHGWQLRTV